MDLLINKNAIITGAARGIGKSIAMKFASEGANVAIIDIAPDDILNETVNEISGFNIVCKGYNADVTNAQQVETIINEIVKDFGKIDILVNNAGITRDNLLIRMKEEDWDKVINVNLKSVFVMSKAIQPFMIHQRSGTIINISSVVGIAGNVGQTNYSASKAGIIGFTKSLAKEIGSRNIRCNAIAPGFVETEMTKQLHEEIIKQYTQIIPLKRPAKPEDIANTAVFLASDMSSYITGQVIHVCGGMLT